MINNDINVWVHAPTIFPLAAMNTVFLIEFIVLIVAMPPFLRFLQDLRRRRRPQLSYRVCRCIVTTLGVSFLVIVVLTVFVYLHYADDRASYIKDTLPPPEVGAAVLTIQVYELAIGVAFPLVFSFLWLALWFYLFTYSRYQKQEERHG
jgi:hypothetical protein